MAALGQLGGNPSLVRALQGKLDGLAGKSSGFIEELHYKVKARVDQLDEIQDQHDELREKRDAAEAAAAKLEQAVGGLTREKADLQRQVVIEIQEKGRLMKTKLKLELV